MRTPSDPPKRRKRAQLTDPVSGKRISVYADDPEALAHRTKRIRDIRDDIRAGVVSREQGGAQIRPYVCGTLTVGEAFGRYIQTIPEASRRLARANWESRLKRWFLPLSPHELNRERMARWEGELIKRGDAPKTIRNSYDHLAGCCRMLIDTGELSELPWGALAKSQGGSGWRPAKAVPLRQRQAVTNLAELSALLSAARAADAVEWNRGRYSDRSIVLGVLLLSGLRQAEGAGLAWDDLSLDVEAPAVPIMRVHCQAPRGWNQKGATRPFHPTKTRAVLSQALHPTVVKILKAQRAELVRRGWYRSEGPVFPGKDGTWRTTGQVIKPARVRELARAAGLPNPDDWVTHSTRHSFSTLEVVASGGDLKRTQARTGHADVRQLEGYLHAAGHLLGNSSIPEIDVPVAPTVALLSGGVEVVAADPWGIDQIPAPPELERATRDQAVALEGEA